jgi:hypothetical protein
MVDPSNSGIPDCGLEIAFPAIGNQNFLEKNLILGLKYEPFMMNLEGVSFDSGQLRTVKEQ